MALWNRFPYTLRPYASYAFGVFISMYKEIFYHKALYWSESFSAVFVIQWRKQNQ